MAVIPLLEMLTGTVNPKVIYKKHREKKEKVQNGDYKNVGNCLWVTEYEGSLYLCLYFQCFHFPQFFFSFKQPGEKTEPHRRAI